MSSNNAIVQLDDLPSEKLGSLEQNPQGRFPGSDINSKLGTLDTSLVGLKTEIEAINHSVAEGMARLDDQDLDLNAKVSETYARLGELDNSYRSLAEISRVIDEGIRGVTEEVGKVDATSRAQLQDLEGKTQQQSEIVAEQQALVTARVNELVTSSAQTSTLLSESIRTSTDGMIRIEKKLVAEIEFLSSSTQKRSDELSGNVGANKARILKLQSVDKALGKRASQLESRSQELLERSGKMGDSILLLHAQASDFEETIAEIQEQQAEMQAVDAEHASLIAGIQKNASQLAHSILQLAGLERRHFRVLSTGLLVALLAIAGVFLFQSAQTEQQAVAVNQELAMLDQKQVGSEADLSRLEQDLSQLGAVLATTNDQVQSLDGRSSYASPHNTFGSDNITHGPQWLANQPSENLTIRLATVVQKSELYKIAQRYGYYLKADLFYYPVTTPAGEFWVLGYGSFANPMAASAAIGRLPHRINSARPVMMRMPQA